MNKLQAVKSHLEPGMVYRRADLIKWSSAVDRHLAQLQRDKSLLKLAGGLYLCPKKTAFGDSPPTDEILVRSFLKDKRFLITTPAAYNSLGVGTTQLYNETVVYNHKRHGRFKLGSRYFHFKVKHHFPFKISQEFLLIDMVNNLSKILEDRENVKNLLVEKFKTLDPHLVRQTIEDYASVRARKFLTHILGEIEYKHDTSISS